MIFDNADGGYEIVDKFLPPGRSGGILITSRNIELTRITSKKNSIEVKEMDAGEAISLLLKSAAIEDNSERILALARRVVSELGYIPLAIDQAGGYVQACGCDLSNYLDLYTHQCRGLMFNSLFKGASNYGKSTYGTWEISMKEIESRAANGAGPGGVAAQSAVIIYKYFAFLHHNDISEDIFREAAENYKKRDIEQEKKLGLPLLVVLLDAKSLFLNEAGKWDRLQFQAGIQTLLSFSLIRISNKLYSIHPMVHVWSRDRMSTTDVSSGYHKTAALLSCSIQPIKHDDNYNLCLQIVPHIRACYAHAVKLQCEIMKFDDECDRFAFSFDRAGNWEEAKKLYTIMMETRIRKLGAENTSTLSAMQLLASTYRNSSEWEMAERLGLQVLHARILKLGANHLDTLSAMHELARTYECQGRLERAEMLQLQALQGRKVELGANHQDTLDAMNNLAVIYQKGQWRLEEAERLQLQVLGSWKSKVGAEHPYTLATMNDLALTYQEQGKLGEAERLQLQVLGIWKSKLGAGHPHTLTVMANLALTYQKQGRLSEAERLLLQVFNQRKSTFAVDHPDTLSIMNILALAYKIQGRLSEAEKLLLQVLDLWKSKLGADHPHTISAMKKLALTYKIQGRLAEVKRQELQESNQRKLKLGAVHLATLPD